MNRKGVGVEFIQPAQMLTPQLTTLPFESKLKNWASVSGVARVGRWIPATRSELPTYLAVLF